MVQHRTGSAARFHEFLTHRKRHAAGAHTLALACSLIGTSALPICEAFVSLSDANHLLGFSQSN
ncbi:protein of unknown function [Pseudomonas sp. JV551A1]|nr:protein of unknown function [Pseudomonas sp. JV551A1]